MVKNLKTQQMVEQRDDFRIEGKKQLKEWYKANPNASKQELIDEADAIADRQIEKARAYILSVEGMI